MRLPAGLTIIAFLFAVWAPSGPVAAQDKPESPQQETPKTAADSTSPKPTAQVKPLERSWNMLTENVQDEKHSEARTQALNALSDLKTNVRADRMIAAAMQDHDLDVRTAAVLAAGKTKSRTLVKPMRELLDDPEPQVVFAAATTLWTDFHDRSGEDVLAAIAAGDRKANPSLIHGAEHDMSRTLHSPSTLAKIGIETGAGMALGPFGFSVSAIEYARKNGGDTARVQAIDLLAEVRTEGLRNEMLDDLVDDDAGVRAAAVRVVGSFHHPQDAQQIELLLDDSKLPVRLAAAAAYIDCKTAANKAGHR
ncbi:MAG TPA: HEAT repeat domain-containing protein [Acidobacteriaceae bacterium]